MRNGLIFLVSFFVAITVFVWTENEIAPSFQACISQNTSDHSGENTKNNSPFIGTFIKDQAICTLRLVDKHNGFFAALAALIVACFTFTLWIATSKQARLTFESLRLAREEFIATNRPEIVVHAVSVRHITGGSYDRLGASILCFNKGRTAAENIEVRGAILVAQELELDVQRALIRSLPSVLSGQKLRIEIPSDRVINQLNGVARLRRDTIATGRLPDVYCVGTISYFDQNKTRRETAFCYCLIIDHHGERWVTAGSPEHEYAF
jgi:hypothetical protein